MGPPMSPPAPKRLPRDSRGRRDRFPQEDEMTANGRIDRSASEGARSKGLQPGGAIAGRALSGTGPSLAG